MSQNLFSDFPKTSREDWIAKATKDLRGKALEDLKSATADHLEIFPIYTPDDRSEANQPQKKEKGWIVIQEVLVTDEVSANKKALEILQKGATGLLFYLKPGVNLEVLLKEIMIEGVTLHFVTEGNGTEVLDKYRAIAENRGLNPEKLQFTVNIDPVENLLRSGNWFHSESEDINEYFKTAAGGGKACINANLYGNAGATSAQQLAFALAQAYEFIHRMEDKNPDKFWFNFSIGSQYFEEVAKFRAARRLWALLLEELDLESAPMHIYAETGTRNKTIYDPWVNMLRTTTEGMSAVIGGCDELNIRTFDLTYQPGDAFSERIARNQQLLLGYESYLDRITDPAEGSYFIDSLTDRLAGEAWEIFKMVESKGGILEVIRSGELQSMVSEAAASEQEKFDNAELSLLGTNIYPNKEERMAEKATQKMFFKEPANTVVQPLKQVRLAEKQEQERLSTENA